MPVLLILLLIFPAQTNRMLRIQHILQLAVQSQIPLLGIFPVWQFHLQHTIQLRTPDILAAQGGSDTHAPATTQCFTGL